MKKFITKYIEDILITGGAACIVAAAFLLSVIPGLVALGVFLLAFGVFLSRNPPGGRKGG